MPGRRSPWNCAETVPLCVVADVQKSPFEVPGSKPIVTHKTPVWSCPLVAFPQLLRATGSNGHSQGKVPGSPALSHHSLCCGDKAVQAALILIQHLSGPCLPCGLQANDHTLQGWGEGVSELHTGSRVTVPSPGWCLHSPCPCSAPAVPAPLAGAPWLRCIGT